jgi:hypothetical protein
MNFISLPIRLSLIVIHCSSWVPQHFNLKTTAIVSFLKMPSNNRFSTHRLLCTSATTEIANGPTVPIKHWDIKGLRDEVSRKQLRTFKKVEKANIKLFNADSESTTEQLEKELDDLQGNLEMLNNLSKLLKTVKSTSDKRFLDVVPDLEQLELSDKPPVRPVKGPPKVKQAAPTGPRLPYNVFKSLDDIEIRVGKNAEDNDDLSCNPAHRDGAHWWMHAAGVPGSHVVIRYSGNDLATEYKQTVIDAALLAAVNSKAKSGGRVQVTLTRCRNVSKPGGVAAGMVQLSGEIKTVTVNIHGEKGRLERLVKIN